MTNSVHEAKTHLSRLLDQVEQGEEIVIVRHGKPAARLVPARPKRKPELGSMRGEIVFKPGWDAQWDESASGAFWEGK